MSSTAVVEQAQGMARRLVAAESRGPGDTDNAMRRLEARYGVPYTTLWSLRYRAPKDMLASVYFRLVDAYRAECDRQKKLFDHELEVTKAIAGSTSDLVRQAAALVGETKE